MTDARLPGAAGERHATRSALFIDFDNVYLTLHAADPRCAEVFATDPLGWLHWLERGMTPPDAEAGETRRILLRRCYLNPSSFRRYRSDFIRAGFKVMDCPSLTRSGKSSSDIHVVMDVLDALQHPVAYDEFILFSGDADFTPVLQRLREHDRRTSILAIGAAAAAYKACADLVIPEEAFVEHALGLAPGPIMAAHEAFQRANAPLAEPELLHRIATTLRDATSQAGPLLATELPGIYKRFSEFPKSNWLGYFSLRSLTEAVVAVDPALAIAEGDPWRIEWRPMGASAPDGDEGIPAAEDLRRFMRRVQELTGAPPLLPEEHAAVFDSLAARLAGTPSDAVTVARSASEMLLDAGHGVPRSHLTFILQTLAHAGHEMPMLEGVSAPALADHYRDALATMLDAAGAPPGDPESELLDRWICRASRERV